MENKPGDLESLAASTGKEIEKEATPAPKSTDPAPKDEIPREEMPTPKQEIAPEEVPDPEEDDLDDLDDMLDEFTPTHPAKPEPKAPSLPSGPGRPSVSAPDPFADGLTDDDFAKQLQAGMAELMGELETSPDMQAQFESMLKELGGAAALREEAAANSPPPSSVKATVGSMSRPSTAGGSNEESFQETIKKTMERMRTSGDQATAAAVEDNTDDLLAEMMKAMQAGGLDGEGGEEEFSKMLLGMMEQLTNKEILYEPMKELDDKFPAWMEKNSNTVDAVDLKRYKEQQIYVREIVKRFELKTYKDEDADDREYIVERMQKMQAAGSPPADLVGDMAAAQEAFGAPDESCPTQ